MSGEWQHYSRGPRVHGRVFRLRTPQIRVWISGTNCHWISRKSTPDTHSNVKQIKSKQLDFLLLFFCDVKITFISPLFLSSDPKLIFTSLQFTFFYCFISYFDISRPTNNVEHSYIHSAVNSWCYLSLNSDERCIEILRRAIVGHFGKYAYLLES